MPYYQIPVDNIIEQSKIIQACGYLAITAILKLGATLEVVTDSHLRDLSQMESIQNA